MTYLCSLVNCESAFPTTNMRCAVPTQTLPAASLRPAKRLPASRVMIRMANYLIYRVFWPIRQAFFGAESSFLPALREAPGAGARSAGQALGAGRDVVEGERHRHTGVKAHQADHVCDALMAESLDRTVEEALGDPARIGKARRHLVDDLLALVVERCRQAGEQRLDLIGRQPRRLAGALMRVSRVGRMPFAVDDDDGDLALALAQGIAGAEIGTERPHYLHELGVVHVDFVRVGQTPARLDQRTIALLLLRRHPVVGDLGIAAKGRRVGHRAISSFCVGIPAYFASGQRRYASFNHT